MLTIPFANPIGPNSGPNGDGIIFGVLPQVAASSVLRISHLAGLSRVLRGNADASGSITYTDVSIAAGNDTPNDVALFDTANPTADRLCIEFAATDRINGIKFLIGTAAVLAGTPVAQVRYKTTSGWQTATGIVTPLLTATGLVSVSFAEINAADIALIDDLIDPIANPQIRCLFLQFTGIASVTTAPSFTRVWKSVVHTNTMPGTILTALLAQGANPDFSGQGEILPIIGDMTLFGFDEKPVRLVPSLYRAGNAGHAREWVYSKVDGLAALPAASINDPSTRLTAALATAPYTARNLVSTLTTGTWGTSGTFSDLGIAGNGYVECKHGPTVTLAHMVGLSIANDGGDNYTGIDYAWHGGHGGLAQCSVWSNGVQQAGPFTMAGGDTLRLERVGTEMRFYQNGTLRHTMTGVPAGTYKIDTTLINLSVVNEIKLVDTSKGYDIPVAFAWASANLVTQTTTTIQLLTATLHAVAVVPPTDWAKLSQTDVNGDAHSRYWVGLRTTGDAAGPLSPELLTLRGQPIKGAGVLGIPAPETATYTILTVVARDPSPTESRLAIIDTDTGEIASITIPSNTAIATATVSLAVTKGDKLALVQTTGHASVNLGDGAVYVA